MSMNLESTRHRNDKITADGYSRMMLLPKAAQYDQMFGTCISYLYEWHWLLVNHAHASNLAHSLAKGTWHV